MRSERRVWAGEVADSVAEYVNWGKRSGFGKLKVKGNSFFYYRNRGAIENGLLSVDEAGLSTGSTRYLSGSEFLPYENT